MTFSIERLLPVGESYEYSEREDSRKRGDSWKQNAQHVWSVLENHKDYIQLSSKPKQRTATKAQMAKTCFRTGKGARYFFYVIYACIYLLT